MPILVVLVRLFERFLYIRNTRQNGLHPSVQVSIRTQSHNTAVYQVTHKQFSMSTAALERPKLLLLGDSLTQTSMEGWGGGLAHRYQRRADVLNRGMSGYNTRWYIEYAQHSGIWYEPGKIALTTIFFGANDASLADQNPHHHVPLDEYQANLKVLVAKTQESFPESQILLITPPPVHHEQRLIFQKQRYGDKATGILERTMESAGKYAEACKAVAKELDLHVLDLYTTMDYISTKRVMILSWNI